jgi:hypothetical protein
MPCCRLFANGWRCSRRGPSPSYSSSCWSTPATIRDSLTTQNRDVRALTEATSDVCERVIRLEENNRRLDEVEADLKPFTPDGRYTPPEMVKALDALADLMQLPRDGEALSPSSAGIDNIKGVRALE